MIVTKNIHSDRSYCSPSKSGGIIYRLPEIYQIKIQIPFLGDILEYIFQYFRCVNQCPIRQS